MKKKIGLIGGTSPESTIEYYKYLIQRHISEYNDFSFPEIIIYSVEFQKFVDLGKQDRWDLIADELIQAGKSLEAAGAECLLLTANTMHNVVEEFRAGVNVPVISILDEVAEEVKKNGISKVALLGTIYTMEKPFYKEALAKRGIETLIPEGDNLARVNDIIYDELVKSIITDKSRQFYLDVIKELADRGAEGVILGCTEIPLLIKPEDTSIPQFNSTHIHAEAAYKFAVE